MAENTEARPEQESLGRYSGYETNEGDFVVYDTKDAKSWIKSDQAVLVENAR